MTLGLKPRTKIKSVITSKTSKHWCQTPLVQQTTENTRVAHEAYLTSELHMNTRVIHRCNARPLPSSSTRSKIRLMIHPIANRRNMETKTASKRYPTVPKYNLLLNPSALRNITNNLISRLMLFAPFMFKFCRLDTSGMLDSPHVAKNVKKINANRVAGETFCPPRCRFPSPGCNIGPSQNTPFPRWVQNGASVIMKQTGSHS